MNFDEEKNSDYSIDANDLIAWIAKQPMLEQFIDFDQLRTDYANDLACYG